MGFGVRNTKDIALESASNIDAIRVMRRTLTISLFGAIAPTIGVALGCLADYLMGTRMQGVIIGAICGSLTTILSVVSQIVSIKKEGEK